jgi:predicted dehydrogenase
LSDDEISDYPVETDIEAALRLRPDAVIVSNPTSLHLDVAIPAADIGCHLFLEKPISNSLDRVTDLQNSVNRGGGHVFVGFQYRFHPGLQKIVTLLNDGIIGTPISVRVHWGEYLPDWHPWEDYRLGYSARAELGGGVILTLCHPLDYLRWFFGEVDTLWAFSSSRSELGINVEDTAEIGLRFMSGVIGSVHLNFIQQPKVHRFEIVGSSGTIRWESVDGLVHVYTAETKEWISHPLRSHFDRNDLFIEEMKHFLDVVKGNRTPICSLQDGIKALEIALMALDSSRQC